MKKYFFAAIAEFSIWSTAFAQTGIIPQPAPGGGGGLIDPLGGKTIQEIINKVIDFMFVIGGPIAAIMVLWGGFQIMTAAGDPEKFRNGRMTILYAAIGLVIVLAAKGITGLVTSIFQ